MSISVILGVPLNSTLRMRAQVGNIAAKSSTVQKLHQGEYPIEALWIEKDPSNYKRPKISSHAEWLLSFLQDAYELTVEKNGLKRSVQAEFKTAADLSHDLGHFHGMHLHPGTGNNLAEAVGFQRKDFEMPLEASGQEIIADAVSYLTNQQLYGLAGWFATEKTVSEKTKSTIGIQYANLTAGPLGDLSERSKQVMEEGNEAINYIAQAVNKSLQMADFKERSKISEFIKLFKTFQRQGFLAQETLSTNLQDFFELRVRPSLNNEFDNFMLQNCIRAVLENNINEQDLEKFIRLAMQTQTGVRGINTFYKIYARTVLAADMSQHAAAFCEVVDYIRAEHSSLIQGWANNLLEAQNSLKHYLNQKEQSLWSYRIGLTTVS